MSATAEIQNEERLLPSIRARLAAKLAREGLQPRQIAQALKVTQPAVSQYLNQKRGKGGLAFGAIDRVLDPLAEKLTGRVQSGLGGVETAELLEIARHLIVLQSGGALVKRVKEPRRSKSLELLRGRLRLELAAAEKYLELANSTSDDYSKLLLRMIASDSIRHGDVVSQIISWLEAGSESEGSIPDESLLRNMLSIEDSAEEESLIENIEVSHPVARLLLQWIDIDENKHEKILSRLLSLNKHRRPGSKASKS